MEFNINDNVKEKKEGLVGGRVIGIKKLVNPVIDPITGEEDFEISVYVRWPNRNIRTYSVNELEAE